MQNPSTQGLAPSYVETATIAADRRILVLSDMHIGDGSSSEAFARKDDRLMEFFQYARSVADAVVIAGDGFDMAQAFSMRRVLKGHRALVEGMIDLARRLPLYYVEGNHEHSGDAVSMLPFSFCKNMRIGSRIRVEHGHAYDRYNQPGSRGAAWAIRIHSLIERAIRSPVRIPMRRYDAWSTRLGHWLFYRYGQYVRRKGQLLTRLGRETGAGRCRDFLEYWGRGEWGDPGVMLRPIQEYLAESADEVLVCGHSHSPGQMSFSRGVYVNSGSWTHQDSTFVDYNHGRVEVRNWPDQTLIGDERYRGVLGPHADKSFFEWWQAFYRGRFRYDIEAMNRAAMGDTLE